MANPALSRLSSLADDALSTDGEMTLFGTTYKTFVLVLVTILSAGYVWTSAADLSLRSGASLPMLTIGSIFVGFLIGLVICFNPRSAQYLAPFYAVFEGVAMGGLSYVYNTRYQGMPMEAVGLTMATLAAMLFLYAARIIRPNAMFFSIIFGATAGLALFYLGEMLLRFAFHVQVPFIHGSGPIGVGFSVACAGLAAFNLISDFAFIEQAVADRSPKYLEWYGGFGILVTLIWLYVEILDLLRKLRD